MSVAIITGSAGLIGSEASRYFSSIGMEIIGIDNDMRKIFFGEAASTSWNRKLIEKDLGSRYTHKSVDIRDNDAIRKIFMKIGNDISIIIHTAAQPSHDWATRDPQMDFQINANGTLNLLEATRKYARDAVFIFTSTNKVYGDSPNRLPLFEQKTRWEIDPSHPYADGIREDLPLDQCLHSLFGASKLAADILVQEYGRYFEMKTACFRGGCLTGPRHSGTQLHGFLGYLMKCAVTGDRYTVLGYKGKQVRDNIHSSDLINVFSEFFKNPQIGGVYNIGGGRFSNCSMLEAIALCQQITGKEMNFTYSEQNRIGDHVWWISDNSKFRKLYPDWKQKYDVKLILQEIFDFNIDRWSQA